MILREGAPRSPTVYVEVFGDGACEVALNETLRVGGVEYRLIASAHRSSAHEAALAFCAIVAALPIVEAALASRRVASSGEPG